MKSEEELINCSFSCTFDVREETGVQVFSAKTAALRRLCVSHSVLRVAISVLRPGLASMSGHAAQATPSLQSERVASEFLLKAVDLVLLARTPTCLAASASRNRWV